MNEKQYQESRKNPRLRKPFIKQVFKELVLPSEYGKFVSGVGYRGLWRDWAMPDYFSGTFIRPSFLSLIGSKGRKSKIVISEFAFYSFKNLADFKGAVVYHEGKHAERNFYNPMSLGSGCSAGSGLNKNRIVFELEAYRNELAHVGSENSQDYIREVEENIGILEGLLNEPVEA